MIVNEGIYTRSRVYVFVFLAYLLFSGVWTYFGLKFSCHVLDYYVFAGSIFINIILFGKMLFSPGLVKKLQAVFLVGISSTIWIFAIVAIMMLLSVSVVDAHFFNRLLQEAFASPRVTAF